MAMTCWWSGPEAPGCPVSCSAAWRPGWPPGRACRCWWSATGPRRAATSASCARSTRPTRVPDRDGGGRAVRHRAATFIRRRGWALPPDPTGLLGEDDPTPEPRGGARRRARAQPSADDSDVCAHRLHIVSSAGACPVRPCSGWGLPSRPVTRPLMRSYRPDEPGPRPPGLAPCTSLLTRACGPPARRVTCRKGPEPGLVDDVVLVRRLIVQHRRLAPDR